MSKYKIKYTTKFKSDYKLIKKQKINLDKILKVIQLLSEGETLPAEYKNHILSGKYKGFNECNIEADWLLIYYINDKNLVLLLIRTGSHSNLFKK